MKNPNFINVIDLIGKHGMDSYRDFEGFTPADELLAACKYGPEGEMEFVWKVICVDDAPELVEAVKDITLNIIHEFLGADQSIDQETAYVICHTVHSLLSCNRWMKSGIKGNLS